MRLFVKQTKLIFLSPLLLAVGWLAIDTVWALDSLPCIAFTGNILFGVACLVLLTWGCWKPRYRNIVRNAVLALAPLAWLYPWAMVPDHIGMGWVSLPFFLEWLVKYPNFGPVNYEVLLGMLCIVGTGVIPVLLIFVINKPAALGLWLVDLCLETALLVRLDCMLLLGVWAEPRNLAGTFGPILRLLAIGVLTLNCIGLLRRRAQQSRRRMPVEGGGHADAASADSTTLTS
jgi:hypothetical protein